MYSRAYKSLVSVPPLLWVGIFLLLPYALMLVHSLWLVRDGFIVHEWNLQNYATLFTNPVYLQVLLRTMRIAASVTVCSLLLGYPLAYYLSFHSGARKELLYQLVIVPLWVSYLVRGYAWKTILGSDGVLNGFLQYLHITHGPVGFLLYSPFAVVLMLTHIYTPFVFLPIYAALETIPRPLVEASQDLGASPAKTFLHVILPLSIPGLLAGATDDATGTSTSSNSSKRPACERSAERCVPPLPGVPGTSDTCFPSSRASRTSRPAGTGTRTHPSFKTSTVRLARPAARSPATCRS